MDMSDISALASLLRQHGDKILSGNHQLTLTASLLQRLNGAFRMIVEHDAHCSFQVVHTTNTKLHELQFLHDFVQKVEALVISHGSTTLRGTVDISKFRNLRQLELRRIPLHMVSGLNIVQPRLKCITASRSVGRPCELLGGEDGEPLPPASWPELRRLSLPHNTLCALDHSIRLATSLKEINLSHNQLSEVVGLEVLPGLAVLDLSYNRLVAIPGLHRLACRTLRALSIAHNQLESLTGIESLSSLRTLHAGWNCLLEVSSLTPLSRLPNLRHLWLEGNPLSRHIHHRERTARRLHPCTSSASQFMLNGVALSEQERRWVGAACLGLSTSLVITRDSETRQQGSKEARRGVRVREAVIADLEVNTCPSLITSASLAPNCGSLVDTVESEHLETKRQIECLREKLGDSWLGAVPDVLGLADNAEQVIKGSYQRHEAQAWLDSQQCPSPANHMQILLSQSPCQSTKPQTSERRSSLSTSDEPPSLLSTSPETDELSDQPLQQPPLLSMSADASTLDNHKFNLPSPEEDEEEEDEEGSDPPFLVQKEMINSKGEKVTRDFFVIIGPSMLIEREASGCSKVSARWPLEMLQSCERPTPSHVTLIFDTMRRDKQLRNYMMEPDDALSICRILGARLEARTLRDMNQVEFHCMRCSTYFSAEITGGMGCGGKRCPSCGSGVIVQEDVDPDYTSPKAISPLPHLSPPHSLHLTHSESQSSIGVTSSATATAVNAAADITVAADIHPCSHTPSKKSSAASLDQSMCDSGLGLASKSRHGEGGDSDIEVLSNPSQSSIEILPPTDETHSREHSVAPSTEAKPNCVTLTISGQLKSPMGLTESSSSGSMTDSVCTAYESATSASVSGAVSSSLGAVLGTFLQRLSHSPNPTASLVQQPVSYSYSDFSRVDHRLKLYLCMYQLKHDNELLTALLRSWVLPSTSSSGVPFSGLLVLSSQALYILRITGPEGDSPEAWLVNEGSWPLSQVTSVLPTAWHYGIGVTIQVAAANTLHFTFFLGDVRHSPGFLAHICGLVPATCLVRRVDSEEETTPQPQVVMPLLDQENASHFTLAANFLHAMKQGSSISYGPLAIAISSSHVALSRQDLHWICEPTSSQNWAHIKPITSLMEVELSGTSPWLLRLRFMEEIQVDETQQELTDNEDEWMLWFVSQRARLTVTEALRSPWEKYFEVPLDVRIV